MKIRIMYYKPVFGKWLGLAISGWTKIWNWNTKSFSHVELWLPGKDGHFEFPPSQWNNCYIYGKMFTSTMRQGGANKTDGVVLRPASGVLKHPERWWYQEIEVSEKQLSSIRLRCKVWADSELKYDKKAIASFFFPWRFHSNLAYVCSEVVWDILLLSDIVNDKKIFSPRRMSKRTYKYSTCPISELKQLKG